jgi:hypothetical protein
MADGVLSACGAYFAGAFCAAKLFLDFGTYTGLTKYVFSIPGLELTASESVLAPFSSSRELYGTALVRIQYRSGAGSKIRRQTSTMMTDAFVLYDSHTSTPEEVPHQSSFLPQN